MNKICEVLSRLGGKPCTYLMLLAAVAVCSGCAARDRGDDMMREPENVGEVQALELTSTPAGATARLSSGESCTTPCTIRKANNEPFSVTFEKEGYRAASVKVSNNLEALRRYNKKRGMNVDLIQVQKLRLVPNPVTVRLEPKWSK